MSEDTLDDIRELFRRALQSLCDPDFSTRGDERPTLADLGSAYDDAEDAATALKALLTAPRSPSMTDQKLINRIKLMLDHVNRTLDAADPDMRIAEKLLSDALGLVVEANEPPNPYADRSLRPGLDVTNYEGKADG